MLLAIAILGAVSAAVSAGTAVAKGVQARNAARRSQFASDQDFHRSQVVAMTQGSRAQLAAARRSALDAQTQQARLLNESEEQQRKALLFGGGAVLLGMFLISMRK